MRDSEKLKKLNLNHFKVINDKSSFSKKAKSILLIFIKLIEN